MFALDTDTVAYFFRGEGRVAPRLLATAPRDIALPAIVAYELRYGIARLAADLRAQLERLGQPIAPHDVLIAATALAAQATLVTRNVAEFSRVPGLRLENWFD